MRYCLIAILLMLAGCASQRQVWGSPHYTPESFAAIKYQCLQESQGGSVSVPVGSAAVAVPITNNEMFSACMNAHGYTLQNANQ
jgi:hypothetical protein